MAVTPFVFYAELALGADLTASPSSWSWTDATADVGGDAIAIKRGRSDRYAEASHDECRLTFNNAGGKYVPRNPRSPLYGLLRRNTPLRISIRPQTNSFTDDFNRTASSAWNNGWTVTGGAASDYSVAAASGGRHLHTAASTPHYSTRALSMIRSDQTFRVRVNATSTGAPQTVAAVGNYIDSNNSRRGELQFDPSGAVIARCVRRSAGVDTVFTTFTTFATWTAAVWYRVRVQIGLTSCRLKIWTDGTAEPTSWTADSVNAGLGGTAGVAGGVGVYSMREAGNTNANATIDVDDYTVVDGPRIQFTGFVDSWPVTWGDHALTVSYAPITASGQLRRLGETQPLKSLLYMLLSTSPTAVAYWPMEDGSAATTFAPALPGGQAGTFSGISLAADSAVAGSEPLPTMGTNGKIAFQVPPYDFSGTWAVAWVMKIPAASISGAAQVMSWITPGGTVVRWQLTLTPGSPDTIRMDGFLAAGGTVSGGTVSLADIVSGAEVTDGRQLYIGCFGDQNGGNVDVGVTVTYLPDDGGPTVGVGRSDSFAGTTSRISYIYHDSATGFAGGGHTIGHIGLGDGDVSFGAGSNGVTGGAGDTTQTRFGDLLRTQGIDSSFGDLVRGTGSTSQLMGPQQTGDVLAQLQQVEKTEIGVMHDGKQGQVHLLPRSMRYTRPVDLTLDVSLGHVGPAFAPVDDIYALRNLITVNNLGGSTAVSRDQNSITYEGVHPDSPQVNIYRGVNLQQHAEWRKNLGVAGGLRYPSVQVNMTSKHLTLANAWFDTDIGSRIQVLHVPSNELPPEDLDLIIDGYTETISSVEWTVTLNTSDGRQYLVEQLDSDRRLDCGASTTSGSLTTTATSVPLAIADRCTWTHGSGDFPIVIGGEWMTVTAVSAPAGAGSAWTQTLTVVRSVNGVVKSHSTGAAVHVAYPIILAL